MYQATALIDADPATVWAVLVDLDAWPSWESAVVRTEGRLGPGGRVTLWPATDPDRAFRLRVTTFEPERALVLEGGLPLGLFCGTRSYRLTPDGPRTRFVMREDYSGPLTGLITRSIPDLQPSFETFAAGLRQQAEQRAG